MEHFDFPHIVGGYGRLAEYDDDYAPPNRTRAKRTEKEQAATTKRASTRKKNTKRKLTKLSRWSAKNISEPVMNGDEGDFHISIRVI
jgi:hypothetical protein